VANDPLHQFQIKPIVDMFSVGGMDFSFTNSSLFMVAAAGTVSAILFAASRSASLVPSRIQSIGELWYEFIANMVRQTMGSDGMKFFPFVFTVFSFVLMCNLLGMFPYFFTVTSHVAVTAALAVFIIAMVVVVGMAKHGLHFFKLFVPSGVPMAILPFISLIEIISFLSRPVSLSLRLFGNMMAGHIVLKVFTGFVVSLGALGIGGILGALFPLAMGVALTGFEFLVAFLQAFVFAILTCVYLNDALHPGH
jgi:F-type H+-transporting ATPase subunit a